MYSYKNEQKKCGSYEYCSVCKKEEEFPCAKAKRRVTNKKSGKTRVAVLKA